MTTTISNPPVTLWVRKQIEVNTDPQRRCYDGCHARSEMQWTAWGEIITYRNQDDNEATAKDSAATFKRINPTREYRVLPEGQKPN